MLHWTQGDLIFVKSKRQHCLWATVGAALGHPYTYETQIHILTPATVVV